MRVGTLMLFALLAGSLSAQSSTDKLALGPEESAAGLTAPDFTLLMPDGAKVKSTQLRGKGVVLSFWASWCVPCRAEVPRLNAISHKFTGRGLVIFGINTEDLRWGDLREQAKRFGMEYPVVAKNAKLEASFGGILALPVTFIIDRHGRIIERIVGEATLERLERDAANAVAGRPLNKNR